VSPDVQPVFGQEVDHPLLEIRPTGPQVRQAIDGVADKVEAIEVVQHGHVERCRDRAFFLVSPHVQVVMIRPAVGEPVNQPRISVIRKDDRLVAREQEVEIRVAQPVRMLARRLEPHEIHDVHDSNAQLWYMRAQQIDGEGGDDAEQRRRADAMGGARRHVGEIGDARRDRAARRQRRRVRAGDLADEKLDAADAGRGGDAVDEIRRQQPPGLQPRGPRAQSSISFGSQAWTF